MHYNEVAISVQVNMHARDDKRSCGKYDRRNQGE
jgi:hypothetical protein